MLDARRSLDQVAAKLPDISGVFGKLPDVSAVCFAYLFFFGWIVGGAGGIGCFCLWILVDFGMFFVNLSDFE